MKQRRYDTGVPFMQFRIDGNETVSRRGFHVKLYLGIYDFDRRRVRCVHGEDGGGDERGARVRRGRGLPLHHHDRRDGAVGGIDGDCAEIGTDSKADERDTTLHQLSFSAYPERASGEGVHSHELDCKCAGAWLGVYAGGALSYYNDRLKNPLRNQGFPPNLVLMKKCSFASKHF